MTASHDAIALLKADHKKVKQIFDEFEKSKEMAKKEDLAQDAITELKIHSVIEEEIFYPAVREALSEEGEILDEAEEEHRVAKTIIEELDGKGFDDAEHFEAKFMVLAENIRHHIKEEESEMFPEVRESDLDLSELGARMMERKHQLESDEDALASAVKASHLEPYQQLA